MQPGCVPLANSLSATIAPAHKASPAASAAGAAAAVGRSPEPLQPQPQSSAGPSKKKSFLGRLQIPKRAGAAQPAESAAAAATRPVKPGSTPLQAQTSAVDAGATVAAFIEPVLGGGSGAQHSTSRARVSRPARVASDGEAGAGAAADEGETPESDTVDDADVSWAVTLPPRPPQQRPASVPLLHMDWGRKTVSPSEGIFVPVL